MIDRCQAHRQRPKDSAAFGNAPPAPAGRRTDYGLRAATSRLSNTLARVMMGLVRLYQVLLSPFLGGQCRFHPTCSNYALHALESHGPLAGAWLALKRLLKCHPFHPGGFDPPPQKEN